MYKKLTGMLCALLTTIIISLAGCGSGGSNGTNTVSGAAPTVSGVAAVGSPLVGTVSLKDSSTPAKEQLLIPLKNDGSFTFDVTGMQGPFILQATGTVGTATSPIYTMYSFAATPGTANINPISNVAVATAAGTDPAADFASPSQAMLQNMANNMPSAVAALKSSLKPLLDQYGVTTDPISGTFVANGTGLDAMFDAVTMGYSSGVVTVMNTRTTAVIFTGQSNNMSNGMFTMSNMPTTTPTATPAPTTTPTTTPAPTTTPTAFDGAAFYTANCTGCHGALATSQKLGATVAQIQSGITSVGGMSSFSSLTATQIQAIATALSPGSTPAPTATATPTATPAPTATPTPTPTPTATATPAPAFNALSYYNLTCLGCHGSLGVRTAAQIQAAINSNRGGMGSLGLTAAQVAAIAAVSY